MSNTNDTTTESRVSKPLQSYTLRVYARAIYWKTLNWTEYVPLIVSLPISVRHALAVLKPSEPRQCQYWNCFKFRATECSTVNAKPKVVVTVMDRNPLLFLRTFRVRREYIYVRTSMKTVKQ